MNFKRLGTRREDVCLPALASAVRSERSVIRKSLAICGCISVRFLKMVGNASGFVYVMIEASTVVAL